MASRRPNRERAPNCFVQDDANKGCWDRNDANQIGWVKTLRFFNVNDSNLGTAASFAATVYMREYNKDAAGYGWVCG